MSDTPLTKGSAEVSDTFVRRWGDMAAAWGINRTMAEIQGLLYITGDTLSADQIMERLGISRGNASMSLRSLVDWGVVRRVHRRGERRDYYESLADVWEIFRLVAQQRKRKEIDPVLATLRECHERLENADGGKENPTDALVRERLEQMLEFLATLELLAERFVRAEQGLARAVDLLSEE